MTMMTKHILCLITLGLNLHICMGQTQKVQTIDFRALAMTSGIETQLYYMNGESFEGLTATHYRPSARKTAHCDEEGRLILFEKVINPEGIETYIVKRRVGIPNESRQVLLLLAQSKDSLGIVAVHDNLSTNDKDWLFINLTPSPLLIQLGKENEPFRVSSGQALSYQVKLDTGRGAAVLIAALMEEKWKRVYSTFWPVEHGQRALVICVPDGKKVGVRKFYDSVITAEEEL